MNTLNSRSVKRGIYNEVARRLASKGVHVKVPTVRMRIIRKTDPRALEIYAEILEERMAALEQANGRFHEANKKLESINSTKTED
ncbi:hypothetical protein CR161_03760 [Prosthecochloris sp. ZM]|uniref:hypothetical protein n=1 Tax=Prosthecochloris sp. ZM TaxID=2283143 RepID=UPI000DF837B8|nr:hypothetical protein [Prosthecochloris sp. ZM]RDD29893.1 hypothetical protein CR161_03760 [Prosthecochloris sp. ZM]